MSIRAFFSFILGFVISLVALMAITAEAIEVYEYTDSNGVVHWSDTKPEGVEEFRVRDTSEINYRLTTIIEDQKTTDLKLWTVSDGVEDAPKQLPPNVQVFRERRQFGDRNKEVWVYYRDGVEVGVSEVFGAIDFEL